jgi:hypothetical protein
VRSQLFLDASAKRIATADRSEADQTSDCAKSRSSEAESLASATIQNRPVTPSPARPGPSSGASETPGSLDGGAGRVAP